MNSDKLQFFINLYQSTFGDFPCKGPELQEWKNFLHPVPIGQIRQLIDLADGINGESRAKPRLSVFKRATKNLKTPSKTVSDAPWWRKEAAERLGIPLSKLPEHGNQLTPGQRKILDIPEPEEAQRMLRDIKKIAAGDMTVDEWHEKYKIAKGV